jgi:hypothetical protein
MVAEPIAPTGRGRTPKELEPLLSVDAIDGCRKRVTRDDLCAGTGGIPNTGVTVRSLTLLYRLGVSPFVEECGLGLEGPSSVRSPILGSGESGGEAKGAIVALMACC